jgi:hypothetical protein
MVLISFPGSRPSSADLVPPRHDLPGGRGQIWWLLPGATATFSLFPVRLDFLAPSLSILGCGGGGGVLEAAAEVVVVCASGSGGAGWCGRRSWGGGGGQLVGAAVLAGGPAGPLGVFLFGKTFSAESQVAS